MSIRAAGGVRRTIGVAVGAVVVSWVIGLPPAVADPGHGRGAGQGHGQGRPDKAGKPGKPDPPGKPHKPAPPPGPAVQPSPADQPRDVPTRQAAEPPPGPSVVQPVDAASDQPDVPAAAVGAGAGGSGAAGRSGKRSRAHLGSDEPRTSSSPHAFRSPAELEPLPPASVDAAETGSPWAGNAVPLGAMAVLAGGAAFAFWVRRQSVARG
jgi:hypothetical protein